MTRTSTAITGLHHVGLVVRDIAEARRAYARLGFVVPPATFPALPPSPGAAPQAFGAGNTHAEFRGTFLELATVVDAEAGIADEDVQLHVINAPDEVLALLTETIDATTARLRASLEQREGLHILAFRTPDADAAAQHLDRAGVAHGAVQRLQRPIETDDGPRNEPIGYFELDEHRTPEGRLAVAEDAPAEILAVQRVPEHPNTAFGLTGVHLGVPDDELTAYAHRYGAYLGVHPRQEGQTVVFDLAGSRVTLVPASAVPEALPGASDVPGGVGFLACAVRVRDRGAAAAHLEANAVPFRSRGDALVVAPRDALGAALILEP
ncbi:VOC family protein [Brevibacterium aurantiacum]|uniref:VOC family protein n=1 Tax=Brevibacterium aurantiacum TaxID=273384 RepID=A0A4Z0KHY5_BREAU|nr:VOC family protein [Brevibacterium aurantiacum]TGD38302.1 VOC family protein [Brevibacterium aurantiacum]